MWRLRVRDESYPPDKRLREAVLGRQHFIVPETHHLPATDCGWAEGARTHCDCARGERGLGGTCECGAGEAGGHGGDTGVEIGQSKERTLHEIDHHGP